MEIVWHGHACFRISERNFSSVVTDPYSKSIGLPELKLRGDIVTVSHDAPGHNNVRAVKSKKKVLTGPGEYEIGSVFITGIRMDPKQKTNDNGHNTMFVFDFMGLTVAHMGALAYVPSQSQIENLGAVDIVLIPVGGGELTPSQAAEVVSLIEPSIVIPMHFATKEGEDLDTVDRFLKEMGIGESEPLESLKVSRSSLSEETQVVVLTPAA